MLTFDVIQNHLLPPIRRKEVDYFILNLKVLLFLRNKNDTNQVRV
jgi:hypothetical protein